MFDLEDNRLEDIEPINERADPSPELVPPYAEMPEHPMEEPFSVEETTGDEEVDDDPYEEPEGRAPRPPWRRLVRLAVPIAVVLYIAITTIANR